MRKICFAALVASLLLAGCNGNSKKQAPAVTGPDYSAVETPTFCADSAYQYTAAQVNFGFRTPGSEGQRKCASYIANQMNRWCDTVIVQNFTTKLWNGKDVRGKNIIASIEAAGDDPYAKRILLGAHWDSRAFGSTTLKGRIRGHFSRNAPKGAARREWLISFFLSLGWARKRDSHRATHPSTDSPTNAYAPSNQISNQLQLLGATRGGRATRQFNQQVNPF